MNPHIPARSISAPLIENTTTEALPIENLAAEIQEHICAFISVYERADLNSLSCVSSDFNARMEGHRKMAKIIAKTEIDIRNNHNLASERLADLLPKLSKFAPPLRAKFFNYLATLANRIRNPSNRAQAHQLLYAKIRELPVGSRADAIYRLVEHNDYVSFPCLVDLYDDFAEADKPEMIMILALELHHCKDREFPRVMDALFKKIDALSPLQRYEALGAIRKSLFDNRGREELDSRFYNVRKHHFFSLAYEFIVKLPMPQRIMAIGKWTAPERLDYKFNDEISLTLLSAIPADVDPNPMVVNAIVKQMKSNFNFSSDLHSLARFRTILKGISHLSPACRAAVIQCWSEGCNSAARSEDLQWQAMFEECGKLPDPHRGNALISLASRMSAIHDAFYWSGEIDDSRNSGNSELEKAANTEKRRKDATSAYLENEESGAELAEYYQATSFTCIQALPALLRLSRELPEDQREKILENLCLEQYFSTSHMDEDERALYRKMLSEDILALPDQSAQERLSSIFEDPSNI